MSRAPTRSLAVRGQVLLGGAAGTLVRAMAVAGLGAAPDAWPWDLVAVNLAGALLLGWLAGRAERSAGWQAWLPLLGTGLAGALTTFSSLAVALVDLGADRPGVALLLAAVLLGAGWALAHAGLRLGHGAPVAAGSRR